MRQRGVVPSAGRCPTYVQVRPPGLAAPARFRWRRSSMTLDEFLAVIDDKLPPAPLSSLEQFESLIGQRLPEDYREFLVRCNGGYAAGSVVFQGPTPEGRTADACPNHIGGFREED